MRRRLITLRTAAVTSVFGLILILSFAVSEWFVLGFALLTPLWFYAFLQLKPFIDQSGRRYLVKLFPSPNLKGAEDVPLSDDPQSIVAFAPNSWHVQPLGTISPSDVSDLNDFYNFIHWELAHVNKRDIERSLEQLAQSLISFCARMLDREDRWMWIRYEDPSAPAEGGHVGVSLPPTAALDSFTQVILTLQFFVEQAGSSARQHEHVPPQVAVAFQINVEQLARGLEMRILKTLRNYVAHVDRPPIWINGYLAKNNSRIGQPVAELGLRLDASRLRYLRQLKKKGAHNSMILDWLDNVDPVAGVDLWPLLGDIVTGVQEISDRYDDLHSSYFERNLSLITDIMDRYPKYKGSLVVFENVTATSTKIDDTKPMGQVHKIVDLPKLLKRAADLAVPLSRQNILFDGRVPIKETAD